MTRVAATLFDGETAQSHAILVDEDPAGLVLSGETEAESIDWSRLALVAALPDAWMIRRTDRPGWRLKLPVDAPAAWIARLPRPPRFGGWIDRFGFWQSAAVCSIVSGLLVLAVVTAPGWLAPRIPATWGEGMSDDVVGDLSANVCHTPAADAALAALASKLDRDAAARHLPPVRIELLKWDEVNAVALPGGRVLVFDGLLHAVPSSDALAGVIGHEIGHVRLHHVMKAVLRQYGIAMLLGGYRSRMTNALGNLASLQFSREDEHEADEWSRKRLDEADISPLGTARFFVSLEGDDPAERPEAGRSFSAYLASHPEPSVRALAFRADFRETRSYRPAIDQRGFSALVNACADDTRAKPFNPLGM